MKKVVSIGEILGRFTALNDSIKDAKTFSFSYGGSEANVLISLSSLGEKCVYITRLPTDSFGDGAIDLLRKYDIDTNYITFDSNYNLGFYYWENVSQDRSVNAIYNRKNSAATHINIKDYNLQDLFKDASLFHFSGISIVLSEQMRNFIKECIKYAKKNNIPISFDFNYRKALLSIDEAKEFYKEFIYDVDYVFCSIWDLKTFLNLEDKTDEEVINYAKVLYKYIFMKNGTLISANKKSIYAICYTKDSKIISKEFTFEIVDRVGAGDAFCAGVLHGLLNNIEINKTLDYGIANLVLEQSIHLDYSTFNENDIDEYLLNGKI